MCNCFFSAERIFEKISAFILITFVRISDCSDAFLSFMHKVSFSISILEIFLKEKIFSNCLPCVDNKNYHAKLIPKIKNDYLLHTTQIYLFFSINSDYNFRFL